MPIGAMKVARCFSAASMKMVKTSSAVKNISMKSPRATFVSADNVVATANFCQGMHVLVSLLANDGMGSLKTYVRKQRRHNACSGDGPNNLRDEDHSEARVGDATDERETESHGRVEQATRDTEEDPSVDSKTEAERQRDVQQRAEGWMGSGTVGVVGSFSFVRDLGTSEREEEEEERAEELANSLRHVSSLTYDM
jgi:hypothetical protein